MNNNPYKVDIDSTLEALLPSFLENRIKDISLLRQAIKQSDFEVLSRIGHNLQGPSGVFGIKYIVALGRQIEVASQHRDLDAIQKFLLDFESFMSRIEVNIVSVTK